MAETRAIYRAIAEFGQLQREARRTRKDLQALQRDTDAYTSSQAADTKVTEDHSEATSDLNAQLVRASKVMATTSRRTKASAAATHMASEATGDLADEVDRANLGWKSFNAQQSEVQRTIRRTSDDSDTLSASIASAASALRSGGRDSDVFRNAVARLRGEMAGGTRDANVLGTALRAAGGGGGVIGGRVLTDLGKSWGNIKNLAGGFLSTLFLISPTVNTIVAGLIGVVSLLTAGAVAAAAFGAAFIGVSGAIAFALYKWRDLLSTAQEGVTTFQQAVLAVEAHAFNVGRRLIDAFSGGVGGRGIWDTFAQGAIKAIDAMSPYIERLIGWVVKVGQAFAGVGAQQSAFVDFFRVWLKEWEVLSKIVNEDIPEGAAGLEKYEKPARAFVEGIAMLINSLRKVSIAGFGLDMDQLAETIRNVFTWLSKMLPLWTRFSSALTPIALTLSQFLLAMQPVIDAIVDVGATIMEDFLAPLVQAALFITGTFLKLPVVSWFASIAGGIALVLFAIKKLTFGLLTFGRMAMYVNILSGGVQGLALWFSNLAKIVTGLWVAMVKLGNAMGVAVLPGKAGLGAGLAGSAVAVAALAAAWWGVHTATSQVNEMYARLEKRGAQTAKSLERGVITLAEAEREWMRQAIEEYDQMGWLGKWKQDISNMFKDPLGGGFEEWVVGQKEIQKTKWSQSIVTGAVEAAESTGVLSDETVRYLDTLRDGEGTRQHFRNFITQLNESYAAGLITESEYLHILQQLGVEYDLQGNKIDTYALSVQGVANTIAQAIEQTRSWQEALHAGGGALQDYALASGQDYVDLATDVEAAFTDMMGGLLVTGSKVNELFQKQAEQIVAWKTETADAFNAVKSAFSSLAGEAGLTFEKVRTALQQGVASIVSYSENWNKLKRLGATKELLAQIHSLGLEGAGVLEAIVSGGRSGVGEINELVREGADLSKTLASEMAKALGIVFDKFILAIIKMVSVMTNTSFPEVLAKVEAVVGDINGKLDGLKDQSITIDVITRYTTWQPGEPGANIPGAPPGQDVTGIVPRPFRPLLAPGPQMHGTPIAVQAVQEAERDLAEARNDLATSNNALAGANENLEVTSEALATAEGDLASAQEQAQDAQEALTQAREDARMALQDLRMEAQRAALDERGAQLDLIEARRQLQEMYREGGYTDVELERQQMAVKYAVLSAKDAKRQNERTQEELTKAEEAGIKGSEQYQSALEALQGAQEAVTAASEQVAAAMVDQTKAEKDQREAVQAHEDAVDSLRTAHEDLKFAMDQIPDRVPTTLHLDTTQAESALFKFLKELEEQGVKLVTDVDTTTTESPPKRGKKHSGGWIDQGKRAPGLASDEVPIIAQAGEYVVRRSAAKRNKETLEAMNRGRRFHTGGPVDMAGYVDQLGEYGSTLAKASLYAKLKIQRKDFETPVTAPEGAGLTPSGLTVAAQNFLNVMKKAFPQITGWGGTVVRTILGTNIWSQHAYGNAIDAMTGSNSELRRAAAFFVDANRSILRVRNLLADPWFPSPLNNHWNHVHTDFNPTYTGTPPGHPVTYHRGGFVRRPGQVHMGEYVINARSTSALGSDLLEALNSSFASPVNPRVMQGVGASVGAESGPVSIVLDIDGQRVSRIVDVHSREMRIRLPGR